ncbi:hypothetical protein RIF29_25201 [Crotalaria pallida]|uniref:C2H2-type domain-containing protein n=1 Tax=Crotalaria pallida TaxID=3830 RepID=A0AAN9EL52_CROPI
MAIESSNNGSDSSKTIKNSPFGSPHSPPPPPPPPPHRETYKCFICLSPFPNPVLLGKHHREDQPCSTQMQIKNMNETSLNMIGNVVSVLQPPPRPPPLPSPPTPLPTENERTLETPFLITNATGENVISGGIDFLNRFHPYLRQEYNPISVVAAIDRCPSLDNRTLDLISQLEPTRNFLCMIENQTTRASGNATYGANATLSSRPTTPVDLTFKL